MNAVYFVYLEVIACDMYIWRFGIEQDRNMEI